MSKNVKLEMSKYAIIIVSISIITIHNYPDNALQDREKFHLSSLNCRVTWKRKNQLRIFDRRTHTCNTCYKNVLSKIVR